MNDLDLCLEVVSRSRQPLRYIWRLISRKPLEIEVCFQRTTNRKWHMGYRMVTWPMTSRDLERSNSVIIVCCIRLLFCVCMHMCNFCFLCVFLCCFPLQLSPSVLWYCWLGLLTCKNRLRYNLYCVGGDVKHCTIQSNDITWPWKVKLMTPNTLRSQYLENYLS